MRIYLIRHGETDFNRERRMQGHGEVPLNDAGIAQVTRLGQRLAGESIDHIYSSDLRRTVMTAAVVASHTGAPLTYDAGLRERDPGELTGGMYDDGIGFFTDPDYIPPGGESVPVFEDRVRATFDALVERESGNGRRVAIVTHGMVCLAFLKLFAPQALEGVEDFSSRNASVSILNYDGGWHHELVLDIAHLDGIDLLNTRDAGA